MNQVWEFHFDGTFTPCDIPEVNRVFEEDSDVFDSTLGKHGFSAKAVFTEDGAAGSCCGITEARLWINSSLKVWLIDLYDHGWVACRDLPSFLEFVRRYESFLRIGVLQEIRQLAHKVDVFLFDPVDGLDVVKRFSAVRNAIDEEHERHLEAKRARAASAANRAEGTKLTN